MRNLSVCALVWTCLFQTMALATVQSAEATPLVLADKGAARFLVVSSQILHIYFPQKGRGK